ncbi:hypothetical protein AA984_15215 [Brevibacillus formosus]|uniref:D-glucuronyl C5-epimerase C-terminal domain-containing protein n=1 Tax=Brevibacillus formosus TaxID=54913 RepID=A0A837KPT7_9BACL|nr:hypothetical protein AA984_15215 [Brevibacillus formosus]
MMRKKPLIIGTAFVLFIFILLLYMNNESTEKPILQSNESTFEFGTVVEQKYQFRNNDLYWIKRIEAHKDSSPYVFHLRVPGNNAVFRYNEYQDNKFEKSVWKIIKLNDVQFLPLSTGFIETENRNIWISMPNVYANLGKGTIEEKFDLQEQIQVIKDEEGYLLEITLPVYQGLISEIWALESNDKLVRWDYGRMSDIWLTLDLNRKGKWSYDGYYVKSPSTYLPYNKNSFWRIPENYILKSFIYTGESRIAEDMGYVMLETALKNQEAEGYWKSLPASTWLQNDYGIQDGFFDTRFNIGQADLLLEGCKKYQEEKFCKATQRFADYFSNHAEKNHFNVLGGKVGWLVEDYAHPNGNWPTHVSLNHQLAEINYLYKMYNHFHNENYKVLAEKLLYGIENIGGKWITESSDLHYAYFPNGTLGRPDYPYLTFNDLQETQKWQREIYGTENDKLNQLIQSKKKWMQSNNIKNPFGRL